MPTPTLGQIKQSLHQHFRATVEAGELTEAQARYSTSVALEAVDLAHLIETLETPPSLPPRVPFSLKLADKVPAALIDQIYMDYIRSRSMSEISKKYSIGRSSLYNLFHHHKLPIWPPTKRKAQRKPV
jgi:hypothetical protein